MKAIDVFFYFGVLYLVYCIIYQFMPKKITDIEANIDPLNLENSMKSAIKGATSGKGISWHEKISITLSLIWNIAGFFTNEWLFFILLFFTTSILPAIQMIKPKHSSVRQIRISVVNNVLKICSALEIIIISCMLYHHFFVSNKN